MGNCFSSSPAKCAHEQRMEIIQQKIDGTATEIKVVEDEILIETMDSLHRKYLQQKLSRLVQEKYDLEIAIVMEELSRADIAPKREKILNDHLLYLRNRPSLKEGNQSDTLSRSLFRTPTMKMRRHFIDSIDPQLRNPWTKKKGTLTEAKTPTSDLRIENMRTNVANYYRCKKIVRKEGKKVTMATCCVTGKSGDHTQVLGAHLLPLRCHKYVIEKLDMSNIENGINNFRNFVLLSDGIEKAFDDQRLCFVSDGLGKLVLRILDPTVASVPIFPGAEDTIGKFEGTEMKFPDGKRPFTRVLSFHAQMSLLEAIKNAWEHNAHVTVENTDYGSPLTNDILFIRQYVQDYAGSIDDAKTEESPALNRILTGDTQSWESCSGRV